MRRGTFQFILISGFPSNRQSTFSGRGTETQSPRQLLQLIPGLPRLCRLFGAVGSGLLTFDVLQRVARLLRHQTLLPHVSRGPG